MPTAHHSENFVVSEWRPVHRIALALLSDPDYSSLLGLNYSCILYHLGESVKYLWHLPLQGDMWPVRPDRTLFQRLIWMLRGCSLIDKISELLVASFLATWVESAWEWHQHRRKQSQQINGWREGRMDGQVDDECIVGGQMDGWMDIECHSCSPGIQGLSTIQWLNQRI